MHEIRINFLDGFPATDEKKTIILCDVLFFPSTYQFIVAERQKVEQSVLVYTTTKHYTLQLHTEQKKSTGLCNVPIATNSAPPKKLCYLFCPSVSIVEKYMEIKTLFVFQLVHFLLFTGTSMQCNCIFRN